MALTIEQAVRQGVSAHKAGKLQEAERLYRAILESQPFHPDANHNLGVLSVSVNKAGDALPLFKVALEANPKVEQFWLSYVDALIKEKQFDTAKQIIKKAKKQGVSPKNLKALRAQLSATGQKAPSALSIPSQQQLNTLLAHYQAGQVVEAEQLALSITQAFPGHPFAWKILGAVLKQAGRLNESLVASQRAVELAPQDTEAHNNLGVTLIDLGRLDEAEASLRQAIELKPDSVDAHCNLGVTFKAFGRLDEAKACYEQAIALNGKYAEAHYNLGIILQEMGRLEDAEACYGRAIALRPGYAEAHNNLGNTLRKLGRLDEAETCYTRAIASKKGYDTAIKNRGLLLFNKGSFKASLRDFDSCDTEETRAHSLVCLDALGQLDDVYKRISIWSEKDEKNIQMAAFSSFVSARYKKETGHKYCNNPLEFLYF